MKRTVTAILLAVGTWFPLKATHLLGGEITYHALDSVNYRVFVTLYRDCNGVGMANIPLNVSYGNSDTAYNGTLLSMSDVTNYPLSCTSPRSRCSGGNTFGIQKYTYGYDISLANIPYCEIRLSWEECCRINSLTQGGANQDFYIETRLNKCIPNGNSSLFFQNEMPPLMRHARDKVITFAGQDSTGSVDSVVFSLVNPLTAKDSLLQYINGYSYNSPFNFFGYPNANLSYPAGFHFNAHTGNLSFRPNTLNQVFNISAEVKCYKRINGVQTWAGTIHRNYTGIVSHAVNIPSGGSITTQEINTIWRVCAGDSLRLRLLQSGATGVNFLQRYSPVSVPLQITTSQGTSSYPNVYNITYFPDSSHVSPNIQRHIHYILDSTCHVSGIGEQSVTLAFIVVPEIKAHHKPVITVDKGCNIVSLKARDTFNLSLLSFKWTYNGTSKTGDSVFFFVNDTGWHHFSVLLNNGGECFRTFDDSFYMDSVGSNHPLLTNTIHESCIQDTAFLTVDSTRGLRAWYLGANLTTSLNLYAHTLLPVGSPYISVLVDSNYCYYLDTLRYRTNNNPKLVNFPFSSIAHCTGNLNNLTLVSIIDSAYGIAPFRMYWNGNSGSLDTSFYPQSDYYMHRKLVDSLGCEYRDSVRIIKSVPFTLNAGNDTSLCSGAGLIVNGTTTLTQVQTLKSGWDGSLSGLKDTILYTSPRYLVLEIESTSGCRLKDSIYVSEYLGYSAQLIGDTIACPLDTLPITFTTSGGAGTWQQVWQSDSTALTDPSYTHVHQPVNGLIPVTFMVRDSNFCVAHDTLWISNRLPSFVLSGDSTFLCVGDTIRFRADSLENLNPVSYEWYSHQTGPLSSGSLLYSGLIPGERDTLFLNITDDYQCVSFDTLEVRVSGLEARISAFPLVCGGDSLWVSALVNKGSPGFDFDWNIGPVNRTDSSFYYTPAPGTSETIELMVTDKDGCFSSDSFSFTTTNFQVHIIGDTLLCVNDSTRLRAQPFLGPAPFQYVWTYASQTGTAVELTLRNRDFPEGPVLVFLEATDSNTCTARDSAFVWMNKFSSSKLANSTACLNDTIRLIPNDTSGIGAVSYLWQSGTATDSNRIVTRIMTTAQVETWVLLATDDHGCSFSDSLSIDTRQLMTSFSGKRTSCGEDSLAFVAHNSSGFGQVVYEWEVDGNNFATGTIYTHYDTSVTRRLLTLRAEDENHCLAEKSDSLYFMRKTNISFSHDEAYCADHAPLVLDSYVSPAGGIFINDLDSTVTTFAPQVVAPGIHSIFYKGGDAGCEDSAFTTIYVHAVPTASFFAADTSGYQSHFVQFHSSIVAQFPLIGWDFGDGNGAGNMLAPSHLYTDTGKFDVTLFLKDSVCHIQSVRPAYIHVLDSTLNGLSASKGENIVLYPNPFLNDIWIKGELYDIRLLDMLGKEIPITVSTEGDVRWVRIGQLPPGTYVLVGKTNGGSFRRVLTH